MTHIDKSPGLCWYYQVFSADNSKKMFDLLLPKKKKRAEVWFQRI